jgi:hypothetical protein
LAKYRENLKWVSHWRSQEIAKALKNMGVLTATIMASTGLTKEDIEKL